MLFDGENSNMDSLFDLFNSLQINFSDHKDIQCLLQWPSLN